MAFCVQEPQARAAARPTRRASAAFMEMLRGAKNPPVVATATWAGVSEQFEADPRCIAIAEPQRAQMFDTFKDALAQLEEVRAVKERAAAAENYKVRCSLAFLARNQASRFLYIPGIMECIVAYIGRSIPNVGAAM